MKKPIPPSPLVDTTQLAGWLGVSRDHVYRLNSAGKLPPPLRLGHLLRWDCRAIQEWIEKGSASAEGGPEREDER